MPRVELDLRRCAPRVALQLASRARRRRASATRRAQPAHEVALARAPVAEQADRERRLDGARGEQGGERVDVGVDRQPRGQVVGGARVVGDELGEMAAWRGLEAAGPGGQRAGGGAGHELLAVLRPAQRGHPRRVREPRDRGARARVRHPDAALRVGLREPRAVVAEGDEGDPVGQFRDRFAGGRVEQQAAGAREGDPIPSGLSAIGRGRRSGRTSAGCRRRRPSARSARHRG